MSVLSFQARKAPHHLMVTFSIVTMLKGIMIFTVLFRTWGEPAWVFGVRMGRGGPTSLTPKSSRLFWKEAWHPSGQPLPTCSPCCFCFCIL